MYWIFLSKTSGTPLYSIWPVCFIITVLKNKEKVRRYRAKVTFSRMWQSGCKFCRFWCTGLLLRHTFLVRTRVCVVYEPCLVELPELPSVTLSENNQPQSNTTEVWYKEQILAYLVATCQARVTVIITIYVCFSHDITGFSQFYFSA